MTVMDVLLHQQKVSDGLFDYWARLYVKYTKSSIKKHYSKTGLGHKRGIRFMFLDDILTEKSYLVPAKLLNKRSISILCKLWALGPFL